MQGGEPPAAGIPHASVVPYLQLWPCLHASIDQTLEVRASYRG